MENLVEIIGDYQIEVLQDENPENPRTWDNLGTMYCFHSRYDLGDKHKFNSKNFYSWNDFRKHIEQNNDVCVIIPLYLYDHSGITMNTVGFTCRWDSGQVGYIFVTKEKVRKAYGISRITKKVIEEVTNALINEVKTYDQYLTGDVYGYCITDIRTGEEKDSCSGFYGAENCMEEAKNLVKYYIDEEQTCTIV